MYSGSDSTESQNYPQWALNPATYQNVSSDQVDWAALAQQWIIMKEAGPPPVITEQQKTKVNQKKDHLNEGGEAPMEVETDKEESLSMANSWGAGSQQPQPPGNDSWSWNAQSQTWGWNNAWVPPTGVPPPAPMKPPLLPTPANYNQFNAPPESNNDNATFSGYSTGPNNDYTTGYWTAAGSSKQIKPHNRRFSKVNIPRPIPQTVPDPQPPLDAAKRKQLPAWIREGLEKMERDKQKQLEREKEKQEREEYNEKIKQSEKETMEILKSTIKEQQRSKFESDGEYSDEDGQEIKPEPVQLTAEEQMMNVRRAMTEILLKVTNREIETICREELQRRHKKYKASDQRVSAPTGANITAKLGVSMYGSDSESSNEDTTDSTWRKNSKDSDAELKDSIRRKKAEFSKTEKEIADKLAEADARNLDGSRSSTPDTNGNETQVDAKAQGRKYPRSEAPQSQRHVRSSSSSSDDTSYTENKRRYQNRYSSSSSSSLSTANTKKSKHRSTSRSRTPDIRHRKNDTKSRRRSRSTSSKRRRESVGSKGRHSRRSKSRSNSRSRRSGSRSSRSSYRRGGRSTSRYRRSRSRNRRSRSRSRRSRSRSNRRRRSRSASSSKGKRSRRR